MLARTCFKIPGKKWCSNQILKNGAQQSRDYDNTLVQIRTIFWGGGGGGGGHHRPSTWILARLVCNICILVFSFTKIQLRKVIGLHSLDLRRTESVMEYNNANQAGESQLCTAVGLGTQHITRNSIGIGFLHIYVGIWSDLDARTARVVDPCTTQ